MRSFADLRREEFGRLDRSGHVYLDYTGSGLYGESQIRRHWELLSEQVLGNPHSRNPTSAVCTERVDRVRHQILDFFAADAEEYEVIFTLNASGALKLVGESFPFDARSQLVLTADNHNSAHGLRQYAAAAGAEVRYLPLGPDLRVDDAPGGLAGADPAAANLFVFPAQSNFSGAKHPLAWVATAQRLGYSVFLDAAAFVPTSRLDLHSVKPDFVCVSFYKMFGYPTGVGALLARRPALRRLQRPWFGGGTVRFVSAQPGVQLPWETGRGFEDGTLNFQGILALPFGFDFLDEIGFERIGEHALGLTGHLLARLHELRHSNGERVCRVYGPQGVEDRGPTVALNLVDPGGEIVDFRAVERAAIAADVSLRTGYFCNPGAAEFALEHSEAAVRDCVRTFTPESFTLQEFAECLHDRPVGAIRVSLGCASNQRDVERLLDVFGSFRDASAASASRGLGPVLPSD